ncbi:MAG: hypothetical protein HQM10_12635 [Candidatus Riflebacteria bacterium]|nr:hypothetical protein [Candidatus Riflebacteria bacterium]
MKKYVFLFVMFYVFCLTSQLSSKNLVKENASVFLEGRIHLRFDFLSIVPDKDEKKIDRLKYKISCLKGSAHLNNVEYLDSAAGGTETIRWHQSPKNMRQELKARFSKKMLPGESEISHSAKLDISPFSIDTAKVRFRISASGRDYKVIWIPNTRQIFTTW